MKLRPLVEEAVPAALLAGRGSNFATIPSHEPRYQPLGQRSACFRAVPF